jgi:hypothetical protein
MSLQKKLVPQDLDSKLTIRPRVAAHANVRGRLPGIAKFFHAELGTPKRHQSMPMQNRRHYNDANKHVMAGV